MHINKLDSTKASGLDGLGPKIIKLADQALSPSIATLINKSIATGQFPAQLKYTKEHTIHKGGEKSNPSNYRPISILPTVSKIIEKLVNKHLMAFLKKYKLLHENYRDSDLNTDVKLPELNLSMTGWNASIKEI